MRTDTTPQPDPTRAFLAKIPLFGGLGEDTLERLQGMLAAQCARAGTRICVEGEMGRTMYIVRSGEVLVQRDNASGRSVRMVRLGPGEFFGEMTLFDPQPRSATVVVTRTAVLLGLGTRELYELYHLDRDGYVLLLQNLCRELSRRLRRADERICEGVDDEDEDVTQLFAPPFGYVTPRRH